MNLSLNIKLADRYKSQPQKIRVLTEQWVDSQIFCPNCGDGIERYTNNRPLADFYCKKCSEDFELKSQKGKIGKKIVAGAYSKMIERLNSEQKPHFFFMGYVATFLVNDFFVVPKYFFISEIIEKRKALAETARRAGFVGSIILFSKISASGKIFYIEDGKEISKREVLQKWQKTAFLKKIIKPELKGWILDIMNCIESLEKNKFSLFEIYKFEKDLEKLHPENKNIKAKIRQQLQFLRDKGYLKFIKLGKYKLA